MNSELWKRIERTYYSALDCTPDERSAFAKSACGDDEEMRRQLESLLAANDRIGDFLSPSMFSFRLKQLGSSSAISYIGGQLGFYKVLSVLGTGGMSEVYLACDTRLDRQVALKLLLPQRTVSSDDLARFLREAKTASALNHPNIVTIYEIDTVGDTHFIATELIDGQTIRQRLSEGAISVSEALDIVMQCTSALAAAHKAGIVHRDVKPENIMVRRDGVVKVLDFGLARMAGDQSDSGPAKTHSGAVMGTPRYMSPEQARGQQLDERTDIFSLGVVLYEMLAGRALFAGATTAEVFAALLASPAGITFDVGHSVSADLHAILARALQPNRDVRYASMTDFASDLRSVARQGNGTTAVTASIRSSSETRVGDDVAKVPQQRFAISNFLRPAIAMAGIAAILAWFYVGSEESRSRTPSISRVVPLTSFPGWKDHVAFSPDGSQIAFSWNGGGEGANRDIYIKVVGAGDPLRITSASEDDWLPSWSPDGRFIAFLRTGTKAKSVYIVPALGGVERKVAEAGVGVSWSSDGSTLALANQPAPEGSGGIFFLSLKTGERRQLTNPAPYADSLPAFSPDGSNVAFIRSLTSSGRDVYIVSARGGAPRQLTFDKRPSYGLTWTSDSREVVFSSNRGGGGEALWRVPATGGTPDRIGVTLQSAFFPNISRRGDQLAYTESFLDFNVYRYEGPGFDGNGMLSAFSNPVPVIMSSREDTSPNVSPDGKRVAFISKRTGDEEIWVCNRDGSHAVQMTSFGGPPTGMPKWSPDGRWIAFDSRAANSPDIYVVAAEGGSLRRLTTGMTAEVLPSWSNDGKWIYYISDRGGDNQVWKLPFSESGKADAAAVLVTRTGAKEVFESPDGKAVYFTKSGGYGIWTARADGGGSEYLVEELKQAGRTRSWGVVKQGIYIVSREDAPQQTVRFFSFATRKLTAVLTLAKAPVWNIPTLALSPDGRSLYAVQLDHKVNDLMAIESFR